MVILRGKLENYKPPPMLPRNMPHDFLAYGLFKDGGCGSIWYLNIIVPPCLFYTER